MFEIDDWRKIGIGLTGFGIFFTFMGVVFFFDKALLAMGNILFLSGVVFVIGPKSTFNFFFQRKKWRGTTCFLGGIFLVLIGWSVTGMAIELFGFINLFGNFFPNILRFGTRLPIIGHILSIPAVNNIIEKVFNIQTLPS